MGVSCKNPKHKQLVKKSFALTTSKVSCYGCINIAKEFLSKCRKEFMLYRPTYLLSDVVVWCVALRMMEF